MPSGRFATPIEVVRGFEVRHEDEPLLHSVQ
jgi:hypothetical protein